MESPLEVVRTWKQRNVARDFGHMGDVVDLEGYTETCLGLTPWTRGYDVAQQNYLKNMVQPWSDLRVEEDLDASSEAAPSWATQAK